MLKGPSSATARAIRPPTMPTDEVPGERRLARYMARTPDVRPHLGGRIAGPLLYSEMPVRYACWWPHVGHDPAATEAAVAAVKSFLRAEFKLN
jgi:hypothetical protein